MSQHTDNMARRAAEREARRRAREQAEAGGNAGTSDVQPQGQEVATTTEPPAAHVPAQPTGTASRPQPLTPDLIPEPELIDAVGELTADERHDLAQCERAFHHATEAAWMKGKAAHAVRDRRLYREDGRTWAIYCAEEIGESESDVNRQIQEWPLAAAISAAYPAKKAVPASHIRALLPLAKMADLDRLAVAYTELRTYAAEHGRKVTAAILTAMVERFSKAADPLPVAQFGAAIRAIAPVPAQNTAPTGGTAPASHPNLGDTHAPDGGQPGQQAAPTVEPPVQPAPSHPNLGDSSQAPATGNDAPVEHQEAETVDAEIIDEGRALTLLATLTQATETLSDDLRDATPATLKAISEAARQIADTAESLV